ncbi:TPA: ABC transporter substrate-binding protein [Candidatus Saccharibacteria bacterium]|nr:ABC transporter substrate-binding protein [Candidatus Saccharibacteria bacterium]HIO87480.1 ABC transporter substrate-binding protein [Candidatus Saccharibacteria bacterium]
MNQEEPKQEQNKPKPITKNSTKKPHGNYLMWVVLAAVISFLVFLTFVVVRNVQPQTATQPSLQFQPVEQLTLGMISSGFNLYPQNSSIENDIILNRQIFEGLVRFEDRTTVVPLLAESWSNPDTSTWVFKLKPNIAFHSGNILTADDVVYSVEQFKKYHGEDATYISTIESVEATDPQTVTIKTTAPDPTLLSKLTLVYIIDSEYSGDNPALAGTGPYLTDSIPTEETVRLTAFDNYHNGPVGGVQTLTITAIPTEEEELRSALEQHQFDYISTLSGLTNVGIDPNQYGYETIVRESISVNYLGLNQAKDGPLQNESVRRAIYLGIDVDELLDAYDKTGTPASQPVTVDIPGFNPLIERPAHNPEEAKELLVEAGYADGLDLELTYFVTARLAAENIKTQLEELGINVTLDEHDSGQTIGPKVFASGEVDMFFSGYLPDINDAVDTLSFMFVDSPNYSNQSIADQINQSSTIFSNQRLELLQSIADQLMKDVAVVPLYVSDVELLGYNDSDYVYEIDANGTAFEGIHYAEFYKKQATE